MNDKKPEAPHDTAVLSVDARREGTDLVYSVKNTSAQPVWAFLLVPTQQGGKLTFAKDAAWFAVEGDVLVARKVDTPVPDDVKAERVASGAIQLAPGASHGGRITLADEIDARGPYDRAATQVKLANVVLEVGWLPVRSGQAREDLVWEGQPFAYLHPETEPGGQRFVRSSVIHW